MGALRSKPKIMLKINLGKADMAIERFEIDTANRHTITSSVTLCCAETGRVIAVFYNDYDAEALLAAAPRPEAVRQSDAFLVWLPRLIAEYEKQARHNEFTPDVSLDFVKRTLAEYQHAAKQPTGLVRHAEPDGGAV